MGTNGKALSRSVLPAKLGDFHSARKAARRVIRREEDPDDYV
ncbi:hypothetical protein [Streptomyces sp. NPDC001348]